MRRARRRLLLLLLLVVAAAAGCDDRFTPGEDDDDSADDDGSGCEVEALEVTLSGALDRVVDFGVPSCTVTDDLARGVWLTEAGDELLLVVQDPVAGELQTTDVDVTLTLDGAVWTAGPATAEFSSLEPVCGVWTANALVDEAGAFVTLSPQPFGVVCVE